MDFLFSISGFLVGLLIGLTGVGGGALMTPILIFGFAVPPVTAVGTDLLFASITKSAGVLGHRKTNSVDWRVVRLLAFGSLPSALVAVWLLQGFSHDPQMVEQLVTRALGVALVLTSIMIFARGWLRRLGDQVAPGSRLSDLQLTCLTLLFGVVVGALVALTSVGAGAVGVAVLFFLYPAFSSLKIVGTDLAHAVLLTGVAGLGHLKMGSVDFGLLGYLLLGSLPGIWLGVKLSTRVPDDLLRYLLACLLMLTGLRFAL
ncbi:MAG: sulfite exporter TauE/SafE family protein [Gammaproteobacteria bacterium]|nr:sulfite exporter TauE/SafE family protein [Gammaproteobacteria bacterium]